MTYVLIIATYGDGSTRYGTGRRVTSLRFDTKKAADEAARWMIETDPDAKTTIIWDHP